MHNKHFAFSTLLLLLVYNGQTQERSLLSPRILHDKLNELRGNTELKKILVDIETDLVSAISPVTLSGLRYPWLVFTPAFAKAQRDRLESDNSIGRGFNYNEQGQVLSSDLNDVHIHIYQDRSKLGDFIRLDLNTNPASQGIYQVPYTEQVKILIHGFQSGPSLTFVQDTKNAYLTETNHTVIVVNWEALAFPRKKIPLFFYPAVTANAFKVGEKVATLIEYLLENRVILDLQQVHIIGHSLGAHTAGYAGSLINSEYGKKIGRITALDAAFLAFIGPNVKLRLDKSDAKFVDAIHTSGIGVYDPIAHVDFYPNGGRNQVSCYNPETFMANSRDDEFTRAFEKLIQSCSHARAYHFFVKSIKRENAYWSCKCVSWKDYRTFCKDSCTHRERFGEYVSPTARGKYFLEIDP